ncbi:transposase [Spirosoma migulaei]
MAAIAPNGRLYVAGQDQPFTSEDIVWFLNKLCSRYRKRNLLVIWDGAAIHRSEAVKNLLTDKAGRVHLERLPAYSPELNPVELVWSYLKRSLKNQPGRRCGIYQLRRTDHSGSGTNQTLGRKSKAGAGLLPKKGNRLHYKLIHRSIT